MTQKTHFIYTAIIVVFAFTTVWWVDHSNKHDDAAEHYVQHIKDYPLLDPALPFYEKENLIVNIQELRDYLKALPEQNKDWADISIYFEMLSTGSNVTVNTDLKVLPASLMKLPAGMIAMKKVERGEWSMDKEFVITQENADLETGHSETTKVGQSFPLHFLLEKMLLDSDNTSYWTIMRSFTDSERQSLPEEVGLDEEFDNNKKISAKDYTRMLRSLYSSTYLNYEHSQMLLDLLKKSKAKHLLKAGLPEDIDFAHKWGTNRLTSVYTDSGIVYPKNRPYLISVMIQGRSGDVGVDESRANKLMKEISERAYNFVIHE